MSIFLLCWDTLGLAGMLHFPSLHLTLAGTGIYTPNLLSLTESNDSHGGKRYIQGRSKPCVPGLRNPVQDSNDAMKGKLRHGWKSSLDTSKEGFMLKVSF